MPLPLAAPVATSVASAAASTGARSAMSNIFTRAVGGIARAFGFGQSGESNNNSQENTSAISQQESDNRVSVPAAARATSYARPSDTVENISRMGAALGNNNTRERQDVGERLSGSGSVVSLLASIDKNIQALTSFVFASGGLGGGRGAPREMEVGRRSSFSPGAQADINGLIAAAALSAVGQVITNGAAAFQRGRENVTQANEQAAQNRTQLSERQQGGASPGQVMAGNQASRYTVSNEELANLQEMLETPEPGEDAASRELRERLDSQLTTLMNQENMGGGGIRLTEEMVRYRRDRNNRDRTRTLQNSSATQPPMTVEQSIEPAEGSEGVERIINEYQEIQNNAITPPTPPGTERLPLREREPRPARNTQSEPSAFSRALSSAVPRFSLSNAMDVITGRNLNRARTANAIDNEYTSTNINPVVETPMNQQAPTIINNNNIIQGGGQSQPSMSGATGTPSMPAGSGVPPMIGVAPTPPSSPAFYSYSN